jgi:serine/threonine protein kinase
MDHILLARRQDEAFLNTPETRLKIAHQVAFALATLHGMDGFHDDHVASVAHNDVCARQFLYTNDGIYKLFDFDSASFTKFDKNKSVCLERPEHMDDEVSDIYSACVCCYYCIPTFVVANFILANMQWDKIKAPEEFHRHARKDLILKYKADVWVLGNFDTLCSLVYNRY